VQASLKETLEKGGEYANQTFGYNQLHTGGILSPDSHYEEHLQRHCCKPLSDSRGCMHCITTLTKVSVGNTAIQQDFELWTTKQRQDFISSISTWALCYDQVYWVDVGVDPQHLDDSYGDEYLASYRGKSFQTMEEIVIYHDSHVA
jgi:hypothetical protein